MTTKWITTKPKNFDDISNIFSRSSEEFIVNFLAASPARRPLPCGRELYFRPSGTTLSHDLGLLIKASYADNWRFPFTLEQLAQLFTEHYGIRTHKEYATMAEPVSKSAFEEGKAYYERNKNLLTRKYNGEYIAIWDNEVMDHDTSFSALAQRVYKKLGYVSIYMPFVTSKRRVLRFESPRRRRSTVDAS